MKASLAAFQRCGLQSVGLTGMGDTATVAHIMPPMPAAPRMHTDDLYPQNERRWSRWN